MSPALIPRVVMNPSWRPLHLSEGDMTLWPIIRDSCEISMDDI